MGTGQFRPGDTANPNIGSVGILEEVKEARVETLCVGEDVARKVVEALKKYVGFTLFVFVIRPQYCLCVLHVTGAILTDFLELIHMRSPHTNCTRWRISD